MPQHRVMLSWCSFLGNSEVRNAYKKKPRNSWQKSSRKNCFCALKGDPRTSRGQGDIRHMYYKVAVQTYISIIPQCCDSVTPIQGRGPNRCVIIVQITLSYVRVYAPNAVTHREF